LSDSYFISRVREEHVLSVFIGIFVIFLIRSVFA